MKKYSGHCIPTSKPSFLTYFQSSTPLHILHFQKTPFYFAFKKRPPPQKKNIDYSYNFFLFPNISFPFINIDIDHAIQRVFILAISGSFCRRLNDSNSSQYFRILLSCLADFLMPRGFLLIRRRMILLFYKIIRHWSPWSIMLSDTVNSPYHVALLWQCPDIFQLFIPFHYGVKLLTTIGELYSFRFHGLSSGNFLCHSDNL